MPMVGRRHEIARMRSEMHRDHYRKLLRALVALNVIILVLIFAIIYKAFFQPPPAYYASTPTGLVIPLQSHG